MPVLKPGTPTRTALPGFLRLQVACGLLICGLSNQAIAKEYSVETVLRAGGEYDDNVRLADDKISIAGVVVSPRVNLGLRTERLDLGIDTQLDFARFNKSEYDSDDQDVALNAAYAFEYDVFEAIAQVKRDSTRTSETASDGTGEIGNQASRRETDSVGASWRHLFTEKRSLELSASYADVEYDSTNLNLNDYTYAGINAAYSIALSDRTRFITQLAANRFDSGTFRIVQFGRNGAAIGANLFLADVQSDSYGLNVGVERRLSEKLVYSVAVGATYVETIFDSQSAGNTADQNGLEILSGLEDEDDTAFSLRSSLRYEGERITLSVNFSTNTNPSSNGYLLLSNQLGLTANYRVSERSNVFANIDVIDSESLGDTIDATGQSLDANERTFGAARIGVSYRITEALYVELAYRYRAQDREVFDDLARSNAAFVEIVYKPPRKTWSR